MTHKKAYRPLSGKIQQKRRGVHVAKSSAVHSNPYGRYVVRRWQALSPNEERQSNRLVN